VSLDTERISRYAVASAQKIIKRRDNALVLKNWAFLLSDTELGLSLSDTALTNSDEIFLRSIILRTYKHKRPTHDTKITNPN